LSNSKGYTCQFPFRIDDSINFSKKKKSIRVRSIEHFKEITDGLTDVLIAGDTETDGLDHGRHKIVGISFSMDNYVGYYIPIRHQDVESNLPEEEIFPLFFEFMYRNKWLFYNWLFDGLMFKKENIDLDRVRVQDVMAYVFNADTNIKSNSLKWAAKHFLNRDSPTFKETTGGGDVTFDMLDVDNAVDYACQDAVNTFALFSFLSKYLIPACKEVLKYDSMLVRYAVKYYADCIIHIDTEYMKDLSTRLRRRRDSLHNEIMDLMGITPQNAININSEPQLIQAFLEMGIDTGRKTESGQMQVDKASIEALGTPLSKKLVEYSFVHKQITSYTDKLSVTDKGRINYKLFATATGRIASGHKEKDGDYFLPLSYQTLTKPKEILYRKEFVGDDPKDGSRVLGYKFHPVSKEELDDIPPEDIIEGYDQNINIRKAITVPDKSEWYFVRLDYASEEMRIIGGLSRDPLYMKAFTTGQDLYKTVASGMFNMEYDEILSALRKKAKCCVLGLNYGGSYYTIMNNAGLPEDEAKETERKYREATATLEFWKQELVQKCFSDFFIERTYDNELSGYSKEDMEKCKRVPRVPFMVRTAYGRPRWVGYWLGSPNNQDKKFGFRTVVSHKIQGTAGDIIRRVMCELYEKVFSKYQEKVRFVGCIHDEIDLYLRKDSLWLLDLVQDIMTVTPPGCALDLPVEYDIGYSYGELYPFHKNEEGILVCG